MSGFTRLILSDQDQDDAIVQILGGYKLQRIGKTGHYRVVKEDGSAADLPTDVEGGWELHEAMEVCVCFFQKVVVLLTPELKHRNICSICTPA